MFLFQDHPQRYERLELAYYSDTAENTEKFVVSRGIRTRLFGSLVILDRHFL